MALRLADVRKATYPYTVRKKYVKNDSYLQRQKEIIRPIPFNPGEDILRFQVKGRYCDYYIPSETVLQLGVRVYPQPDNTPPTPAGNAAAGIEGGPATAHVRFVNNAGFSLLHDVRVRMNNMQDVNDDQKHIALREWLRTLLQLDHLERERDEKKLNEGYYDKLNVQIGHNRVGIRQANNRDHEQYSQAVRLEQQSGEDPCIFRLCPIPAPFFELAGTHVGLGCNYSVEITLNPATYCLIARRSANAGDGEALPQARYEIDPNTTYLEFTYYKLSEKMEHERKAVMSNPPVVLTTNKRVHVVLPQTFNNNVAPATGILLDKIIEGTVPDKFCFGFIVANLLSPGVITEEPHRFLPLNIANVQLYLTDKPYWSEPLNFQDSKAVYNTQLDYTGGAGKKSRQGLDINVRDLPSGHHFVGVDLSYSRDGTESMVNRVDDVLRMRLWLDGANVPGFDQQVQLVIFWQEEQELVIKNFELNEWENKAAFPFTVAEERATIY